MFDTKILKPSDENIDLCATLINQGEIVGMPTETVYGLAANAYDEKAVKKVFAAKGRPADNPLIVHIAEIDMLSELALEVPESARLLAEKFWGGPLTMVLPKSGKIPLITSGGLDTVGIRMPSHDIARSFIKACGVPIAAPSANISGRPSPTTARHVFDDMNGKIPAILDGSECTVGVESTVICFENEGVRILRPGGITKDDLLMVVDNVILDKGILSEVDITEKAASPGMKYKHYSPKTRVILVNGSLDNFLKYVSDNSDDETFLMCFDNDKDKIPAGLNCVFYGSSSKEQAKNLFLILRKLDELGAKKVYARVPSAEGVGLAVYNRILRAASFDVVEVGE
ncbi:MAG: threonylcarbamoyl-AMP synthase [Ruminococcus sp.]|nr:threonylcarbamoyl-AMP synthase [Ruminococcus sp.]